MSPPPKPRNDLAVRTYVLVCLVALLVMMLAQMEMGPDLFALLPVLAGAAGLLMRSTLASLMLLVALGGRIFLYHQTGFGRFLGRGLGTPRFHLTDLLLCAATLAFVIAHYRLMGLVKNVFPEDPRRREKWPPGRLWAGVARAPRERRSAHLVGPVEWLVFLVSLPIFVILAQIIWSLLPGRWARWELPYGVWAWTGLVLPVLGLAAALLVAGAFLGYWGRRGMSPEEGQVLLQDVLWKETRREQRRLNRWLAWFRLRRERREEGS
jgi:hypothetical protein